MPAHIVCSADLDLAELCPRRPRSERQPCVCAKIELPVSQ